jgi:putative acetyltransferase
VTITVGIEHPDADGVGDLLRSGDEYGLSLYPAESYYALDPASLSHPDVRLFVARIDGAAVGIAAFVLGNGADVGTAELKRMFVREDTRGTGVATRLLAELERTASALGVTRLLLETGPKQPEAIALYEKHGYRSIPSFGRYAGDPLSLCFSKDLSALRSRAPSTR